MYLSYVQKIFQAIRSGHFLKSSIVFKMKNSVNRKHSHFFNRFEEVKNLLTFQKLSLSNLDIENKKDDHEGRLL